MPINPNILLGAQPMQIQQAQPVNQLAQLGQVMQLRNADMQFQEADRTHKENTALNDLYRGAVGADGTINRNMLLQGAAERGLGSRIPTIQKGFAEQDKAKADAFKAAGENYKAFQMDLAGEFTNPNASKESVGQRIAMRVQAGAMDPALGQRFLSMLPDDPAQLRVALRSVLSSNMTAEQMLTAFAPKPTEVSNGQQKFFRDTNPNSPTYGQVTGGAAVQMQMTPGEVATDRRAGATLAETKRHNGVVEGQDKGGKAPAGYRWTPDGKTLEPIPGGPAAAKSENASEGERKAATLLMRLEGSQKQLSAALEDDASAAKPSVISNGLRSVGMEAAANTNDSSARQRVESAQLDMLDAALTLGTGAAYTREQLEGYRKSYFPQIGDDAAAIKDKQDRLTNIINAAKIAAGRAGKQVTNTGGATGGWDGKGANPQVDALLKKYGG